MNFHTFGLADALTEALDSMGFEKPTPVQELAIPMILQNRDLVACAQTGTGKTAAYILPLLHLISQNQYGGLSTLILVPTRELAQQIDQQIEGFSYFLPVTSLAVYGGGDGVGWEQQKKALSVGADIITATPGRLIAMLATGKTDFSQLKYLVLDEADRMLDMGFYDDIMKIISYLPEKRQTMLFSATMPPKIRILADKILHNPEQISLAIAKPAEGIHQQLYMVHDGQKDMLVTYLLQNKEIDSAIVFVSTKEKVKRLAITLARSGIEAMAFHSDLEQPQREKLLMLFKAQQLKYLVATDILSRGIDVEGINLIINYDCPPDPEDYVHRVGRTARADAKGTAITLVNGKDRFRLRNIEQLIGYPIQKQELPENIKAIGEAKHSEDSRNFRQKKGNFRRKPRPGNNFRKREGN